MAAGPASSASSLRPFLRGAWAHPIARPTFLHSTANLLADSGTDQADQRTLVSENFAHFQLMHTCNRLCNGPACMVDRRSPQARRLGSSCQLASLRLMAEK